MNKFKKNLTNFFKENKTELIVLFTFSLIIYGYFGVSTILNTDGVEDLILTGSLYNAKMYLSVGRWGWALICLLFNYYPAPIFCLLLNSILFSISGVYITKIFKIKNIYYKILTGMLLISFPINLIAYSYSAWQYSIGISFFLITFSTYLLTKKMSIKNLLISAILISYSIGIYQIFICFIITFLLYLILNLLTDEKNSKELLKRIGYYFLCILIASIFYVIITKTVNFLFNVKMSSYQGASTMFSLNANEMYHSFGNNLLLCLSPIKTHFFPLWIQIILIILLIINFFIVVPNIEFKRGLYYLLIGILLIFAPRLLIFIKPTAWYHEITLLPYTILFTGGIGLLFKNIEQAKLKKNNLLPKLIPLSLIICLFFISLYDNQMGVMAKKASDASFAYINRMISRIEETPGFTTMSAPYKIYFYDKSTNKEFYLKSNAYADITGITSNFTFIPDKLITGMQVLGFNVQKAKLTKKEENEINNYIVGKDIYPEKSSIFIYNNIIVINN